ncbi:MAG: fumarylacetoacetate hydrolase family protein [Anaerolineae bacterium]|nr:fumarylacetoacetate hydrolase family protein [Anaerolineae bacterium]
MNKLVRFSHPAADAKARVGLQVDGTIYDVTDQFATIGAWLRASVGRAAAAIQDLTTAQAQATIYALADFEPGSGQGRLLAPVDTQEVWAAGVTYERSREARQEEAQDGGDVYARVYGATRPELFFKALGNRVVAPFDEVGIRADSKWNVPEPELAVVFNPALEPVGFSVGNDMSSRDIEGENPLYLPQAKVYTASCALGPGIVLNPSADWPETTIHLNIERGGTVVYSGSISTDRIRRKINELGDYLGRSYTFPEGVVLMTGTGVVPPSNFTLAVGDRVTIEIDDIGALTNTVKLV